MPRITPAITGLRWLMVSAAILSTVACGFQLRGNVAMSSQYSTIRLQADPGSSFTKALIEQLKANDVRISETASIQLTIEDDDTEVRNVSYNSRSKSAEKEIIRRVTFNVSDSKRQVTIVPSNQLQARRAYLYDDNKIAAMQEQEALIREELAFDLATRLMLRLQKQ